MYTPIKTRLNLARLSSSLKARALRGGFWLGAGSITEQAARFTRNLILVRLLAPSAFGTMAIVLSVTSILSALTEVGAREALVQNRRGSEDTYVNATWWLAFGRAATTYVLLFMAAPFVARFYNNSELSHLLRVAVLALVFEGAMSARAYVALKNMHYSKWAMIVHGGGIIGVVVTLLLTFVVRDVWALVLGSCSESVARCLLSYVVCPFLPALRWDRSALRDLLSFSRGLFGLSFLNFIFMRADVFVLAKLYPVAEVGIYTMAVYLIQVPAGFFINLVGQIAVPAFSQIQLDPKRTNDILLRVARLILSIALPGIVFLMFCGRPLLFLIYGRPYAAATVPFLLATWVALINVLNGPLTAVFYALGKPRLHRRCVAAMAASMVILTYPLAKYLGPAGAQWACLVAVLVGFGIQLERARHTTGLDLKQLARTSLFPASAAFITVLVCGAGALLIPREHNLFLIVAGVCGCLLAYFALASFSIPKRDGTTAASGDSLVVLQETSPVQ